MKFPKSRDSMSPKRRNSYCFKPLPTLALLCAAFFIWRAYDLTGCNKRHSTNSFMNTYLGAKFKRNQCKLRGSDALPKGIISSTSDFEMRPLWGSHGGKKPHTNLLAMAVGTKQKANVDKIVRKFLQSSFVVMLFHYDGIVNDWEAFEWSARALHIAVANQTKWWFAKRFLHPDIVSEYSYIFLWDEDLGVENFNVHRYLSVIKKEGLQISQPALDPEKSEVHHDLTARQKGMLLHRKINKILRGNKKCDEYSTEPPCTGWVEMMAPVFSKASWRCAWHMIQNDLVHAWGVDFQLGYCAQGDRTKNIGIVDSDYVIHYGLPTLGGAAKPKMVVEGSSQGIEEGSSQASLQGANSSPSVPNARDAVRKQSIDDLERFKNRWKNAVMRDDDWKDPFEHPIMQ